MKSLNEIKRDNTKFHIEQTASLPLLERIEKRYKPENYETYLDADDSVLELLSSAVDDIQELVRKFELIDGF